MADYRRKHDGDRELFFATTQRIDGGCWVWRGSLERATKIPMGRYMGERMSAPRISWLIHKGFLMDGARVYHRCGNRLCVNPEHLTLNREEVNHA